MFHFIRYQNIEMSRLDAYQTWEWQESSCIIKMLHIMFQNTSRDLCLFQEKGPGTDRIWSEGAVQTVQNPVIGHGAGYNRNIRQQQNSATPPKIREQACISPSIAICQNNMYEITLISCYIYLIISWMHASITLTLLSNEYAPEKLWIIIQLIGNWTSYKYGIVVPILKVSFIEDKNMIMNFDVFYIQSCRATPVYITPLPLQSRNCSSFPIFTFRIVSERVMMPWSTYEHSYIKRSRQIEKFLKVVKFKDNFVLSMSIYVKLKFCNNDKIWLWYEFVNIDNVMFWNLKCKSKFKYLKCSIVHVNYHKFEWL